MFTKGFFARRPSSLSSHACDSMLQDWSVGFGNCLREYGHNYHAAALECSNSC